MNSMLNLFVSLRYLVFALSIICSAVITSVSVWNLGFAQSSPSLKQVVQVDSYVISVGGVGLFLVFAIVFVEVGRNRSASITSRVWFECLWSGLLFMLNISAASLVTALVPSRMCNPNLSLSAMACTSAKVLQAFTWLFAVIIFAYYLLIFVTVCIRSGNDNRMWLGSVYAMSFYDRGSSVRLQSPPTSPTPSQIMRKIFKPPSIISPRPQRATPMPNFAHRSGLSSEYQIEHFQFLSEQPQRPPPAQVASTNHTNLSFYPEFLRASLRSSLTPNVTQIAPASILNFNSTALPPDIANSPPQSGNAPKASPPPLGNWPRADIMSHSPQALKSLRRTSRIVATPVNQVRPQPEPPTSPEPSTSRIVTVSGDSNIGARPNVPTRKVSRSARPSGPRTRTRAESNVEETATSNPSRPPPLDLSNVSALKPNR